ncbi:MAG: small basic protein [Planctomycetes bacterium]|nr:small basic protein [Planctomycetota bacterium]
MSIHSSLRGTNNLIGERSVFTRIERLAALKKLGKFDDSKDSPYGIPKVRTRFKLAGAKKVKAEKVAAPGAAAPGAPAAGGKAAAPAAPAAKAAKK